MFTDYSFCSLLLLATHLRIPGWWRYSAFLALQQREEGVVWMGCDWALLLCHPQPCRTLLHYRLVKDDTSAQVVNRHRLPRFWRQMKWGWTGLFLYIVKNWTCGVSPQSQCGVGVKAPVVALDFRLSRLWLSPVHKVYCCCGNGSFRSNTSARVCHSLCVGFLVSCFFFLFFFPTQSIHQDLCLIKHTFHPDSYILIKHLSLQHEGVIGR